MFLTEHHFEDFENSFRQNVTRMFIRNTIYLHCVRAASEIQKSDIPDDDSETISARTKLRITEIHASSYFVRMSKCTILALVTDICDEIDQTVCL